MSVYHMHAVTMGATRGIGFGAGVTDGCKNLAGAESSRGATSALATRSSLLPPED